MIWLYGTLDGNKVALDNAQGPYLIVGTKAYRSDGRSGFRGHWDHCRHPALYSARVDVVDSDFLCAVITARGTRTACRRYRQYDVTKERCVPDALQTTGGRMEPYPEPVVARARRGVKRGAAESRFAFRPHISPALREVRLYAILFRRLRTSPLVEQ